MDEGRKRDAPLDRDKRDSSSNIIPRVFEIKAPPAAPSGALPKSSAKPGVAFLAAPGGQAMIDKDQTKQTTMTTNCGIMIETRMRNIPLCGIAQPSTHEFRNSI
jgi:hypothetical protein